MAELDPSMLPEIGRVILANRYTIVATTCLLVYDYLLTLPDEARLVWPSKWSIPKTVFLMNRYIPFVSAIFVMYFILGNTNEDACLTGFFIGSAFMFVTYVSAEALLFLRAHAVWGRSKRIGVVLALTYCSFVAFALYSDVISFRTVVTLSLPLLKPGCHISFGDRTIWISIAALLFCETVAMALIMFKTYVAFKESSSHLLAVMAKDGLVYFALMFVLSLANLLVITTASPLVCYILLYSQGIFTSMLCGRLVLRLRGAYQSISVVEVTEPTAKNPNGIRFRQVSQLSTMG